MVHVKMMERCRNLLEDTQRKIAMLFSIFSTLVPNVPQSDSENPKGYLDKSISEDILERVQYNLGSIESQIEMIWWGKLEKL